MIFPFHLHWPAINNFLIMSSFETRHYMLKLPCIINYWFSDGILAPFSSTINARTSSFHRLYILLRLLYRGWQLSYRSTLRPDKITILLKPVKNRSTLQHLGLSPWSVSIWITFRTLQYRWLGEMSIFGSNSDKAFLEALVVALSW